MTKYLKTYLNQIKDTYKEKHIKYVELNKKLADVENKWNNARFSRDLTAQGKAKAEREYRENRKEIESQIAALTVEFKNEASNIRNSADSVFGGLFKLNPDMLDGNAVKLIESGTVSDRELSELLEKYANNYTMCRFIQNEATKRMKEHPNRELAKLSAEVSAVEEAPHLTAVDTLTMWCTRALGRNYGTAEAIGNILDDSTAYIFDDYGNISVEV